MEAARLPRSVAAGRTRSSLGRMGRLWEVPGCHHHHVPTMVMPIRKESLGAALCFCGAEGALLGSFPASLASLMQFGSWKGASRSSHLPMACSRLGEGGQGTIAAVVAEPLSLGSDVPQTSLLGCIRTPKKSERCNPKQNLLGKSQLCQVWGRQLGWEHQPPVPHPKKHQEGTTLL